MTQTPSSPRTKEEWLNHLKDYQITDTPPLFLLGSFDYNVTVLSQQIRALNLACALIESCTVPTHGQNMRLAIVGAGFAGLTLAAALLKKKAAVKITLFEERDTLLPLQQGSDSRWLHPQIYDWPADWSESTAAMLPILNWTAARASDVVVQVLAEWRQIAADALRGKKKETLRLYCNTRHLQVDVCSGNPNMAQVEWVGDQRRPSDGHNVRNEEPTGQSEPFHLVVMAVGFGLEKEDALSYWRNETLGQPSLSHSRATYLVSGQGDGAMIDLLRLRISQYRQDRILDELFQGKEQLLNGLRRVHNDVQAGRGVGNLFTRFGTLLSAKSTGKQWERVLDRLRQRLRRDTDVILHLNPEVRDLSTLFETGTGRRVSFQNALLVFLLYRCGGFAPSTEEEERLCQRLGIRREHIVRRHGPNRRAQFTRLLPAKFDDFLDQKPLRQSADILWKGGYFGAPGRLSEAKAVKNDEREGWRKEYLPGPTVLLATTLCGAVAGVLSHLRPKANRYRVTLHRVIDLNNREKLLQQTCDYTGRTDTPNQSSNGRIFPFDMGTIGQAFACQRPIRSLKRVSPTELRRAMRLLDVPTNTRKMALGVRFVLAIPIVQPEPEYVGPSPVAGILYIDSRSPSFWLENKEVKEICRVVEETLKGFDDSPFRRFDRLRNVQLTHLHTGVASPEPLRNDVRFALEALTSIKPPATAGPFQFNFDFSDITSLV